MNFRPVLVNAFYFVAYRSLVAAVISRVALISAAFLLAFAGHASTQQAPAPSPLPPQPQPTAQQQQQKPPPEGGLVVRFLDNFFNGSQDIP